MERQIEDIKKAPEATTLRAPQSKTRSTNAIQDAIASRVVCQQGSLVVGEDQTTATTAGQHPYCQIQGMIDDGRVMLWQAGKARSKKGRDATLRTTVNYLKRIITLLPYFHGEGSLKWCHVKSPRGEGVISLAEVSICLSRAVEAIHQGDNNSAMGLVDKSRDLLADLIETEKQIVKGGSSK